MSTTMPSAMPMPMGVAGRSAGDMAAAGMAQGTPEDSPCGLARAPASGSVHVVPRVVTIWQIPKF